MNNFKKNQQGVAMLLIVSVMGMATLLALINLTRSGVYGLVRSLQDQQSLTIRDELFSCFDELMIRLSADPDFSDASIDIGSISCDLTIEIPQVGRRLIYLERSENAITRGLEVTTDVDPLSLIKVEDKLR